MRYEYGIFNIDKEKLIRENAVDGDSVDLWSWMWTDPIGFEYDAHSAFERVNKINKERDTTKFGEVRAKRRKVTYGDWEEAWSDKIE